MDRSWWDYDQPRPMGLEDGLHNLRRSIARGDRVGVREAVTGLVTGALAGNAHALALLDALEPAIGRATAEGYPGRWDDATEGGER